MVSYVSTMKEVEYFFLLVIKKNIKTILNRKHKNKKYNCHLKRKRFYKIVAFKSYNSHHSIEALENHHCILLKSLKMVLEEAGDLFVAWN